MIISRIVNYLSWLPFSTAGAIKDCLVGEKELAQYFLSILNRSDEYKKWEKLSTEENEISTIDQRVGCLGSSELDSRQKRQYPTDHTQVREFKLPNKSTILYAQSY